MRVDTIIKNTIQGIQVSEPETSPHPALISKNYLERVYLKSGIPPRICVLSHESLETNKRAAPLWESVLERAGTWKYGHSDKRGLLISGSQGSGKSTALYFLARAAIKSWVIANPPADTQGTLSPPIVVKYFKLWVRNEFNPERGVFKFGVMDEWLNANAIFLDDLTFDASSEVFKPVREFVELLVEQLSWSVKPPPLYITTNNTRDDWDKMLGSQMTDRIAGPQNGLCEIVKCNWESFR